jgi:aspartyl-tRNA(Asn)/glutamyl-tRNA(Gln) amidotransferase subunit C
MARITREEVAKVAALARLSLDDAAVQRMASELDQILEYAQMLSQLDTRDVEPTAHAIPLPTPLREDRALPPLDPELAVANAPEREGTAFVVPKVIEGEEEG